MASDRDEKRTQRVPVNGEAAGEQPAASPAPDGEQNAAQSVERDITELLSDIERERDEYLDLARRTKADFDNYRRRIAGEAREAEQRGRTAIARELIPVLDNLERALAAADPERPERSQNHLAEGVRLVREELAGVLKRNGIESYEPTGEQFDPHLHEAMMMRPAPEDDAGKVLEVLEKGYRANGEVLRPARVVVGSEEKQPPAGEPAGGSEQKPAGGKPPAGFAEG
jgi:molecular chaperone GrpE